MDDRTLGRDYKHVGRRGGHRLGGWVGFVAGLTIGFSVALGLRLQDREPVSAAASDATAEAAAVVEAAEEYTFPDMLQTGEGVTAPSGSAAGKASTFEAGPVILQAGWWDSSARLFA
jgi:hypothetical protein